MKRALAAFALLVVLAALTAQVGGGFGVDILEPADVATIPGPEVQFWLNSKGALTLYNESLGERLSVGYDTWGMGLSNSSTGAFFKIWHGMDTDTSFATRAVGLEADHDKLIGCFCFKRDKPGGPSPGSAVVYIGSSTRRDSVVINYGNFETRVDDTTQVKIYDGDVISGRFAASFAVGNNRVTFHVFDRDSSGAALP